ncbi:MAG TPA: RNA polymerase sigma factor [Gemmataceae bacterium]|jgi:RNA polymerase sigma-70 factor (ECF subfamily)|nr:RNA polymerase sigma factor [Gemmataceae bacterium]
MHPSDRVWRERGLLSAVLAGDERAWQTWYEESFDGLYAYVCWRCGSVRDLTDEVVQETWLTAVRRIGSFDPGQGSFAGWLRGIAVNTLRNQLRSRARHDRRTQPLDGRAPVCQPADPAAEQRDRAERIAHALMNLPERYEAILRAKYLEQQSVAQIADAWQETPKAIESLLTRARSAFREAYLRLE